MLDHKNVIAVCEAVQASSASRQDHAENNLEATKENVSKASGVVINLGDGYSRESKHGKKKKAKKNKGGHKGRK